MLPSINFYKVVLKACQLPKPLENLGLARLSLLILSVSQHSFHGPKVVAAAELSTLTLRTRSGLKDSKPSQTGSTWMRNRSWATSWWAELSQWTVSSLFWCKLLEQWWKTSLHSLSSTPSWHRSELTTQDEVSSLNDSKFSIACWTDCRKSVSNLMLQSSSPTRSLLTQPVAWLTQWTQRSLLVEMWSRTLPRPGSTSVRAKVISGSARSMTPQPFLRASVFSNWLKEASAMRQIECKISWFSEILSI